MMRARIGSDAAASAFFFSERFAMCVAVGLPCFLFLLSAGCLVILPAALAPVAVLSPRGPRMAGEAEELLWNGFSRATTTTAFRCNGSPRAHTCTGGRCVSATTSSVFGDHYCCCLFPVDRYYATHPPFFFFSTRGVIRPRPAPRVFVACALAYRAAGMMTSLIESITRIEEPTTILRNLFSFSSAARVALCC